MKTNKFQYLFFNCFLLVGVASMAVSNIIMRNYTNNAYLVYLFLLPLILLTPLILPNSKQSLKICLNNTLLRILFLSYQLIFSFVLIILYLKITNDFYYNLTSPTIILLLFLLVAVFFSTYGVKNIFHIGYVISIITSCLMILQLISTIKYDFNLLKDTKLAIDSYLPLLGFIFIYLDILITPIFLPTKSISKKDYFILFLIATIVNTLLILQNYLLFDFQYFIMTKFPYITKYLVFSNYSHFEHLDLLYLIFITIYFFFRMSLNTEYSRIFLKIKRNNYLIFIIPIILFILIYISPNFDITMEAINWIMFICTITIFLFLILFKFLSRRRKE